VPLLGAYAGAGASLLVLFRALGRRRGLRAASTWRRPPLAAGVAALVAAAAALAGTQPDPAGAHPGLRIRFLDVGQGDAIVLEPAGAAPVLVDGGPPDAGVAEHLLASGIERLSAVVATHPEADHVGGLPDVLARVPTGAYVFAARDRTTLAAARAAGAEADRVAAGDVLRVGRLRLEVLWPPHDRLRAAPTSEAGGNALAIVLLAKWGRFEVLLAADAEAELAPVEPGRIELLKVAHHGSADAGLEALLERTRPEAAVISVGDENPYGHPAPETIAALEGAGARILRTDLSGEVDAEIGGGHWTVR
jgi:competence protein ComEC